LAAPNFILNTLRNIQRSFLWQGTKEGRKFTLVSWKKVCKPKNLGGLGLRDPTILNKVLSAKIWWRWLKRPQDLWARLWRKKYTPTIPEKELIRWSGQSPGSLIWNAARNNRGLITDHSFWELQSGSSALFWSDSWQQLPALNTDLNLNAFIPFTTEVGLIKVKDYWIPDGPREIWRIWKKSHEDLNIPTDLNLQPLQAHLDSRKILSQQGDDILRWGHSTTGTFNIREAYHLRAGHNSLQREEVWSKIWETKSWPKINTFLWLVVHNNILTWDNLRKRGFIGPSWCQLCGSEEETQNHLLNLCTYSSSIWDHNACLMRTMDRNRMGLRETIAGWRSISFSIPNPQQNLAAVTGIHYLENLERKEQTNLSNSHQDLARSLDHNPLQSQ
jgi:hypothetical protein